VSARAKATPFLKWAGGKRQLLDQYAPHLPALGRGGTYFEPFLGGGALFFHLQPRRAVLSDINDDLINCYRMVRDHAAEVLDLVAEHRRRHCRDHYYAVRALDLGPLTHIQQAARFIYLNRTCFNGLYRVNSKGGFNVPMGRYVRPMATIEATVLAASRALLRADIRVASFAHAVAGAKRGDVVYFDPPYQPLSPTASFTSYSKDDFGEADQRHLAEVFAELTERGVKALVSNSDHPFVRKLYASKAYRLIEVRASRAINSRAERRGAVGELLVCNFSA